MGISREQGVFPMPPRLLLLQAREPGDPVRQEEHLAFVQKTRLPFDAIATHDLLQGPPSWAKVRQFDGLLVGGSGEFNVSDASLPHMDETLDFMRQVVSEGVPMFASCFGFQLLVQALGGTIVRDEARAEVGTFQVCLTSEGQRDELFSRLPTCFLAQLGHKERAETWPPHVIHLAYSERSRYQALRIPGQPIWATQFHPELDRETNLQRFQRYEELYIQTFGPQGYQAILRHFRESPHTEDLLANFVALVFGPQR